MKLNGFYFCQPKQEVFRKNIFPTVVSPPLLFLDSQFTIHIDADGKILAVTEDRTFLVVERSGSFFFFSY